MEFSDGPNMTNAHDTTVIERPNLEAGSATATSKAPSGAPDGSLRSKDNAPPAITGRSLEIRSDTILRVLAYCLIAVVLLHLLAMVAVFGFGHDRLMGLIPLFNMEDEKNVPTYFSSFQLLVAAALLGLCAAQHKWVGGKYFRHWAGLALIFVFLSLDESALIHEKTRTITHNFLGTTGLFYYAWVIPFGALTLVVAATYARFLLALPARTAVIFVLSGAVFVFGAIGLEMFEGMINEAGGYKSFNYMVLVTIEETLEMVGIFAFIYGILDYMLGDGRRVGISLGK